MKGQSEYAQAGVDYKKIEPFKQNMIQVVKATRSFPEIRHVKVEGSLAHAHGGVYHYTGIFDHSWCKTHEGLGNKNWATQFLYERDAAAARFYADVMYCNAMMAVNDCAAQGALPVIYTDEIAASSDSFFADENVAREIARGAFEACRDAGMALVAGESPAYKYLVSPLPPVKMCATFSGNVTGIIAPKNRLITGERLGPGDRIVGLASSGIHANGISAVFRRVTGDATIQGLRDGFYTKLPSGMTIGEALHIRTLCYVPFVEQIVKRKIDVHALLPGTGDGVGKLAFDHRPMRYRITDWPDVPELMLYMLELGVSLEDCLKTFNWGVGYYAFCTPGDVDAVLSAARSSGLAAMEVGRVEEGERCTIFGPARDLVLSPPGK